jgi:hypothetical protein
MFCIQKEQGSNGQMLEQLPRIDFGDSLISAQPEIVEFLPEDSVMIDSAEPLIESYIESPHKSLLSIQSEINLGRELSSSRQPAAPASGFATSQAQQASQPRVPEIKRLPESQFLIRIPFDNVKREF